MENILKYYKENLTAYSLVFKYMKLTYFFSLFIFAVFLVSSYLMVITFPLLFIGIDWAKGIGIVYITILMSLIITVSCLNKRQR